MVIRVVDRKILVLTLVSLILISTNIFADVIILHLVEEHSKLDLHSQELKEEQARINNSINVLLALAVTEYGNSVKNISYHLDIIWEDKDKQVWIHNYKVPGPLFHLGETVRLMKHAYEIAVLYASQDQFFEFLTRIACNSYFGEITRAFNLVYGHIYAFGAKLGEHEIDNTLIVYSQYFFEQIALTLNKVKADGTHPKDQLSDTDIKNLNSLYDQLNSTVTTYLKKPGSEIW